MSITARTTTAGTAGTGSALTAGPGADRPPARDRVGSSAATRVRLLVRREVLTRVRSKAFKISTAVFLVLVLAGAIVPGLIRGERTTYRIGVAGAASQGIGERLAPLADATTEGTRMELVDVPDVAAGERGLDSGDLDALVVDGRQLVVAKRLDPEMGSLVQVAHREAAVANALAAAGVTGTAAVSVLQPEPLAVRSLRPYDRVAEERMGLAFFGVVFLYIQMMTFGVAVATGVIEEKSSRVVEILLAKARPSELLAGKIVGAGLVGAGQMALYLVVGLTAASLSGTVHLPATVVPVAIGIAVCFVLGYGFYAAAYAVAGVLAGRTEDLQSTSAPITAVLVASYAAATFAQNDPEGTLARVVTFLPPATPFVLPLRVAGGTIAWWELLLSVGLLLAGTALLLRLAGRIFAGAALHYRGRLSLRRALGMAGDDAGPAEAGTPGHRSPTN